MEAPSNVGISDEFPDGVWHIDPNAGENGDNEFVCELLPQSPAIADDTFVCELFPQEQQAGWLMQG